MDSGAAGHVMPETMFPHVKIERKTPLKKFVAANGEQIKDLGAKRIPFKTNEGVQRCITFRSANVVKPLISMQKVVQAGNTVVLDEKNPHIRNTRDGTVIKLDVNILLHIRSYLLLHLTCHRVLLQSHSILSYKLVESGLTTHCPCQLKTGPVSSRQIHMSIVYAPLFTSSLITVPSRMFRMCGFFSSSTTVFPARTTFGVEMRV